MGTVIPLPTAAISPIVNRPRRGRYPRIVVSIWTLAAARRNRAYLAKQQDSATQRIEAARHLMQFAQEEYARAQIDAKRLTSTGGHQ